MELFLSIFLSPTAQMGLAGVLGGAIRWAALRAAISHGEGLLGLPVGAILAIYLHPLVGPLVEFSVGRIISTPGGQDIFAGFVTGAWGLQLATFVIVDVFKAGRKGIGK